MYRAVVYDSERMLVWMSYYKFSSKEEAAKVAHQMAKMMGLVDFTAAGEVITEQP